MLRTPVGMYHTRNKFGSGLPVPISYLHTGSADQVLDMVYGWFQFPIPKKTRHVWAAVCRSFRFPGPGDDLEALDLFPCARRVVEGMCGFRAPTLYTFIVLLLFDGAPLSLDNICLTSIQSDTLSGLIRPVGSR